MRRGWPPRPAHTPPPRAPHRARAPARRAPRFLLGHPRGGASGPLATPSGRSPSPRGGGQVGQKPGGAAPARSGADLGWRPGPGPGGPSSPPSNHPPHTHTHRGSLGWGLRWAPPRGLALPGWSGRGGPKWGGGWICCLMSAGMKERWGRGALGVGSRCSGPKGCFDRGWGRDC